MEVAAPHVRSSSYGEGSPKESPFVDAAHSPRDIGQESRSFDSVMEELASVAAHQSELVAQARANYSVESICSQYEERISSLTAQLEAVKSDLASSKAEQLSSQAKLERAEQSAQILGDQKIAVMMQLEQERAGHERYLRDSKWVLKHFEQHLGDHYANLEEFRSRIQLMLNKQEERLQRLSIEYDEELYPHLMQSIAERR